MVGKVVLLFSAQALLAQLITSQCIGSPYAAPWTPAPCDCGPALAPATLAASSGGGFRITSTSPMAITGLSMTSENSYEGPLNVCGTVPFLAAVSVEGSLPTSGCGAINYGCGDGDIAMTSEDIAPGLNPYAGPYGYGPAAPEYGYRGCGCGCAY